ncbi:MAG: hypothetical protein IIB37_03725 [Gemmatimonadetes bacterium]|nr:hypothetical protein [Gemmatimonadota bacterium]
MAKKKRARQKPELVESGSASTGGVQIPSWLPPVVYGALTLFLFRAFVFSQDMLYGSDTVALGYMAREFYANVMSSGGFPLWNPIILGGTPFVESLAGGDSLYPPSALLLFLLDTHRALGWKLVFHVFFAGIFMYGWIRRLGLSKPPALLAGLAYGLAPLMVSLVLVGGDGKIFVIALTPLLFWVTESFLVRGDMKSIALVSLVVGAVMLTTHFQMAYFLFGGVGAYVLFRTVLMWREGNTEEAASREIEPTGRRNGGSKGRRVAVTRFVMFVAAALLGAGVAAVQFLPAVSYVVEHSRRTATTTDASAEESRAYGSSFSLHPEEVVALAIPEFVGVSNANADWARGTYWGRNGFKGNHEYVGLVVLLLAGVSFFGGTRRSLRFFLAGLGGVALLFGLGSHTPLWRVFYEIVPGIDLFRAPSLAIFLFGFSVATLMAFGVERLLDLEGKGSEADWARPGRFLWIASGMVLLGFVLAASGGLQALWSFAVYRDMPDQAVQIFTNAEPFIVRGFMIAVVLAIATAGVAWGLRTARLAPLGAVVALGVLISVDLIRVDVPFIQTQDFTAFRAPDPNIDFLLERQREEDPFRVYSLRGLNGQDVRPGMFGLELVGGHHPNDLARYRELIGMVGSGLPANLIAGADVLRNGNVLRMLNVRYILWPDQFGDLTNQGLPADITDNLRRLSSTTIQGRPYESVYEFPDLPRARLVADVVVLPDEQAVAHMLSPEFDPARQVVLSEPPPIELTGGVVVGSVEWIERNNNNMTLRVSADRPAILILADNWFPAWKARVDTEEVPVLRANHSLRAVPISAGEHTVEFYYESDQLRWSLRLTLLSLAVVAALIGTDWIRSRRGAERGAE